MQSIGKQLHLMMIPSPLKLIFTADMWACTGVTNNINSILLKYPSKPWQCDSVTG